MRNFKWLMVLGALLYPLAATSANAAPARWWPTWSSQENNNEPRTRAIFRSIQYLLRARGQKVVVDGIYGKQTDRAVKAVQRRNGIVASGELNNATWEALVVPLKYGAQGEAVRALQTLLRREEYDVPVNGKFGPATRAATKKFQNVRGLASDGIVGKQTWCMLVDGSVGEPDSH